MTSMVDPELRLPATGSITMTGKLFLQTSSMHAWRRLVFFSGRWISKRNLGKHRGRLKVPLYVSRISRSFIEAFSATDLAQEHFAR